MSIIVRLAKPDDKDDVLSFTRNTWKNGDYIHLVWDAWLNDNKGSLYVAELNEKPVGILRARYLPDKSVWLEGLRVHPKHRRKGVAETLNKEVIKRNIENGLRVFRGAIFDWNQPSMNLARKLGFTILEPKWIIFKIEPKNIGTPTSYELFDPEDFVTLVEKTREYRTRNGLVFAEWAWFKLNRESSKRINEYLSSVKFIRVKNMFYMLRLRKETEPKIEVNIFNASENDPLENLNIALFKSIFPGEIQREVVVISPIMETEIRIQFTQGNEIEKLFVFERRF